ncbi:MAG: protein-L-isoaspartate(D-aspartate) O-methyltransferase [Caldilineales bacterium]
MAKRPRYPHSTPHDFAAQRAVLAQQLAAAGVRDARVLAAMSRVPREVFVPVDERSAAYYDGPLPIGQGQTISQPYVVAVMTELLHLQGHERVLEIGTGSGYQTAILSHLVQHVYTIERLPELAERARAALNHLGLSNISFWLGDGSLGWPEHAPYDAILLTCAAPEAPPPLLEQLADRGRLVAPVGPRGQQALQVISRQGGKLVSAHHAPVMFVPLVGQHGWQLLDAPTL